MSADTTEQEAAEGHKSVMQRWKWAVVAGLAVPMLLFTPTLSEGLGKVVGIGLAVYVGTVVSRRIGISEWVKPRTWKVVAVVAVVAGFFTGAEPQGVAVHGFGAIFLYFIILAGIWRALMKSKDAVTSKLSDVA